MGDIGRREVLSGAGKLAIAAGAGLRLGGAGTRPGRVGTATVRRLKPDWAALARRLNGRLSFPRWPEIAGGARRRDRGSRCAQGTTAM
jgi:hypothetical protein